MKFNLCIVFVCGLLKAPAQTLIDPVYFNVTMLPSTQFSDRAGSVQVAFAEFNVTVPPANIGKTTLLNSVYGRITNQSFADIVPKDRQSPSEVYDFRYSLITRTQLNTHWEFVVVPRIMLRSDLQQTITRSDFFSQVVALGNYLVKGNKNFKIGIGMALNNDFERNAIIPIGSLYYDSKKVKVEIVYPNSHFLYKHSANLEYGLFATVDGSISRIRSAGTGDDAAYFRNFQLLVAPTVSRRIYKNFFGHLKVGVAPLRSIQYLDTQFRSLTPEPITLQTSLFIRAGLSYRIQP